MSKIIICRERISQVAIFFATTVLFLCTVNDDKQSCSIRWMIQERAGSCQREPVLLWLICRWTESQIGVMDLPAGFEHYPDFIAMGLLLLGTLLISVGVKVTCFTSSWILHTSPLRSPHSLSQSITRSVFFSRLTRMPSCRWQTRAARKHAKNCSNSMCLQRCGWQYCLSLFV